MASLDGFDASQVPEQQEFTALPEGTYPAIAVASEMKVTSKGTGQYLQFTFEVLDGPHKGRKVWSRLNLHNPNQVAVDIARKELAAFCRAVGVTKPSDSSELHNKPVLLTIGIELNDRRAESNVIKKYEAITGGYTPAPHATVSGFVPQQAAAAAAPAAAATPPWKR